MYACMCAMYACMCACVNICMRFVCKITFLGDSIVCQKLSECKNEAKNEEMCDFQEIEENKKIKKRKTHMRIYSSFLDGVVLK